MFRQPGQLTDRDRLIDQARHVGFRWISWPAPAEISLRATTDVIACDDRPVCVPEVVGYSREDQRGFAKLVNDTHAEFGFSYHPVLDEDLADPTASYSHLWVLKCGDRIVGSVALRRGSDGSATLKRMYLVPQFRGMGWGRRLIGAAIDQAIKDGCVRVELDTSERQQRAARVYEAAGFSLVHQSNGNRYYELVLPPDRPPT